VLPIARAFQLRGMVMMLFPSRFTVRWFMRWAGFGSDAEKAATGFLEVMYRGLKYFRMPAGTMRIVADPLSDAAMRALPMPVLLLMGEQEVLCDAAAALERGRRLIPDFTSDLLPRCSHDMCATLHDAVDARVLVFLENPHRDGAVRDVA